MKMSVSVMFSKSSDLIAIQNALGNPKVLEIGQTDCVDMMEDTIINGVIFADFGLTQEQVMQLLYETDGVDFYPCGMNPEGEKLYSSIFDGEVMTSDGYWWNQDGDVMGKTPAVLR
jgi:hypothetical protein